jgi:hypothetical protein
MHLTDRHGAYKFYYSRYYFQNNYLKFIPILQQRPHHTICHVAHQFIQGVLEGICHATGEISCTITKVFQLLFAITYVTASVWWIFLWGY